MGQSEMDYINIKHNNFDKEYLYQKYNTFQEVYNSVIETYFDMYVSFSKSGFVKTRRINTIRSYLRVNYSRVFNGKEWVPESISYIKLIFPNLEKLFYALDNSTCRYYVELLIIISPDTFPPNKSHAVLLLFDNEYKTVSLIDPNNQWGFYQEINTLFKNLFSDTWYTFISSHENDLLKKSINVHKPGYCLEYSILFSELFLRSNEDPDMILQKVTCLSEDSRHSYICTYRRHLYNKYQGWIKN